MRPQRAWRWEKARVPWQKVGWKEGGRPGLGRVGGEGYWRGCDRGRGTGGGVIGGGAQDNA